MVGRILRVASIATLVVLATWRPSPSDHLGLDLMACAGAAVLAASWLFRREIAAHWAPAAAAVAPSSTPGGPRR